MPQIDREQLLERVDGDLEFLQETYNLFCVENKMLQAKLRAAFEADDLDSVQSVAHSIKGLLSNFLAFEACETAGQIVAIKNPEELTGAALLLGKLTEQVDTVDLEIRQIIQPGTP